MVKIKFSKFAIYAVRPPAQPMMLSATLSEIRTAEIVAVTELCCNARLATLAAPWPRQFPRQFLQTAVILH